MYCFYCGKRCHKVGNWKPDWLPSPGRKIWKCSYCNMQFCMDKFLPIRIITEPQYHKATWHVLSKIMDIINIVGRYIENLKMRPHIAKMFAEYYKREGINPILRYGLNPYSKDG